VCVAAVVEPGDRLLPRVAALRERDVRRVEPGFGGEDLVVDLVAPAPYAGFDPAQLELRGGGRQPSARGEHLARAGPVGDEAFVGTTEDEQRLVFLRVDLAPCSEAEAQELRAYPVAEPRLRENEEVHVAAAPHDERRDHARLRRQQQRRTRLA